jgi:RNA-directed DNA polymerase
MGKPAATDRLCLRSLSHSFTLDFIITGTSKELLEGEVKPCVEQFMKERGLELSQEKTVITCVDNGFDFLGHHVRKYHGKYIAKPSRKNVHAFLETVRSIVKANKQAKVENLIGLLNPVIRGWAGRVPTRCG